MPRTINKIPTKPTLIRLSENMIKRIDLALELGQGNNRSDIIKMAIANYLRELDIDKKLK